MNRSPDTPVADAGAHNWVDRYAPAGWRPYMRLARLDRPIGIWLLLWPCWWSLALAAPQVGRRFPEPQLLVLFAVGAVVMRGAGCTFNDIADRDLDAKVARTASRPLPSGSVGLAGAALFLIAQALLGLLVLLSFNPFAVALGTASLLLVAVYPFMKRVTDWPQAVLGLTFNWGALLGWAATTGRLDVAPVLLYMAGVFWTLGYDTIYAHQDKEDDALIGVRSTALRLGARTKRWLWGFYGSAVALFAAAGWAAGLGPAFYLVLILVGGHFAWQISRLDTGEAKSCLAVFGSNRELGALVFVAIVAGA